MTPPLTPAVARTYERTCRTLRERLRPYHAAGLAPSALMQTLGTFGRRVPIDLSDAERAALHRAIRDGHDLMSRPLPTDGWAGLL